MNLVRLIFRFIIGFTICSVIGGLILFILAVNNGLSRSSSLSPRQLTADEFLAFKDYDADTKYLVTYFADHAASAIPFSFDTGHTFVRFTKSNVKSKEAKHITFGLHSDFNVFVILNERGPSVILNNDFHSWKSQRRYRIDQSEFNRALDYVIETGFHEEYDLQSYNCTDFVLEVAKAAGTPLPESDQSWFVGQAASPYVMGQHLKKLNGGNIIN